MDEEGLVPTELNNRRGTNSQPSIVQGNGLSITSIPSRLSLTRLEQFLRQQLQLAQIGTTTTETDEDAQLQLSIQIDRSYETTEETPTRPTIVETSPESNPGSGEEESIDTSNTNLGNNDSTRIELQVLTKWLENSIPFILLLLTLFLYQHKNGIILFLWHSSLLYHLNQTLKKQIALKEHRQPLLLLGIVGILLLHIAWTYLVFNTGRLWRSLLLLPPAPLLTIWDVIWLIVVNDLMVRFGTMIVKCFVAIFYVHNSSHKRLGQLYTMIEITSHLYRCVLPIPVWFTYFLNEENGHFFSCIIAGLYLTFKLSGILGKFRQFAATSKAYIFREVPFGTYATLEEVSLVGDMCAICQEKMAHPVKLGCKHIFCESCVSEWFEREKTCPLCRAVIKCAGNQSHSDGSTSMLVQLF